MQVVIPVFVKLVFQSTHPLRGATRRTPCAPVPGLPFQSTHPLRGATNPPARPAYIVQFQSTHPLRGATDGLQSMAGKIEI